MRENYPTMPSLPGKTLFKLSKEGHIEDRRKVLCEYMKTLINRKDMRACNFFRKFIDLDVNFP